MTVTTQSSKVVYQGNGATTVWDYAFEIPEADDVVVTVVDRTTGAETVIAPISYSITGLGNPAGGTLTYPLSGTLSSAYSLVIQRIVPLTQEIDLVNQDGFYPEVVEDALDQTVFQTQQLQEENDRTLRYSIADSTPGTIPTATARASKLLGFDSAGDPVAVEALDGSVPVSAYMESVLLSANQAALQSSIGLTAIPSGSMMAFGGAAAPAGFLLCDGASLVRTDYPALFTAIGVAYGAADASHFNVPDMRGRVAVGKDGAAGRVTATTFTPDGNTLGAVGGAQTHALAAAENATHTHIATSVVTDPGHTHVTNAIAGGGANAPVGGSIGGAATNNAATTGVTIATSNANQGSGTPHNNMPPGVIANYIIKT